MPPRRRGANQHGEVPLVIQHPNLPNIIQGYINQGIKVADIPDRLQRLHQITTSKRTVERMITDHKLRTTRKPRISPVELGAAVLDTIKEDPLGKWGSREIKEKLGLQSVHVSRDFLDKFRGAMDPEAALMRNPRTRKVHTHHLHSTGPHEEWGFDGHEKILSSMGIGVYGIIDKYGRHELHLRAVPNTRLSDLPVTAHLLTIREQGGFSVTTTIDKGSETGKQVALQTTLRHLYAPDLDPDVIPPARSVKSVYNITRERYWRPLWSKYLKNILHFYESGRIAAGYRPHDNVHRTVALWLWGKIVQKVLDEVVAQRPFHKIRYQRGVLLPTGGQVGDFMEHPERWNGTNLLIQIPREDIDELIREHANMSVYQFGTDEEVAICEDLFKEIGEPDVKGSSGWEVFHSMIAAYSAR